MPLIVIALLLSVQLKYFYIIIYSVIVGMGFIGYCIISRNLLVIFWALKSVVFLLLLVLMLNNKNIFQLQHNKKIESFAVAMYFIIFVIYVLHIYKVF